MTARRDFLRGLVALPMFGGAVTLIGQPTAAAVPISLPLAEAYLGWLRIEHTRLMHEIVDRPLPSLGDMAWAAHSPQLSLPDCPDLVRVVASGPAYSRAAVTLSAAGLDLATADTSACTGLAWRKRGQDVFDPFDADRYGGAEAFRDHVFRDAGDWREASR